MANPNGRPRLPLDQARARLLTCRLRLEEESEIEQAAASCGETKSEWVRKRLLEAARVPRSGGAAFVTAENTFAEFLD